MSTRDFDSRGRGSRRFRDDPYGDGPHRNGYGASYDADDPHADGSRVYGSPRTRGDLARRSSSGSRRRALGGALGAAGALAVLGAGVAIGAVLAYRRLREGERLPPLVAGSRDSDGVRIRQAVTIRRSAQELYEHWRKFENLPSIMRHLERVEDEGRGRSHWEASGPFDTRFEWDARLVADEPGERISWRSTEDSTVPTEGTVRFLRAPDGEGTRLLVDLTYHPPLGAAGAALARLFGDAPNAQVADDLRRFKRRMETGSVTTAGPSRPSA